MNAGGSSYYCGCRANNGPSQIVTDESERSYEGLLKRRTAELQRCFHISSQGVRK